MHRFVKPSEHEPLEPEPHQPDDGQKDHKEINNARRDDGDKPLSAIVTAIHQLERSKQRAALFGNGLTADHGWEILLLAYLYQASGTPVSHDILIQETGLSDQTVRRYINAMHSDALIDAATLTLPDAAKSKVEALLSFSNEPHA